MKIGLFTDTYTPEVNGVVTVIAMMTQELRRSGHEVFVFCPRYPGHTETDPGVRRYRSSRMVFYKGMRMAVPYSRSSNPLLSKLDIIHSHDPGPLGLLALWAGERYRIPHVHTYHDLYMDYRRYLPPPVRPSPEMVKRLSRMFSHRCATIIAPSEQMKQEIRSYGVRSPIVALPFGVDAEDFSQPVQWDARTALNLPHEDILLYAGRVAREKNLELLVGAFEQVVATHPAARLVIAGDGPYRRELQHIVTGKGLDNHVIFTGFLERPALIDFYKQATMFVFPSMTDTQGLVVMEAMTAGAPVVAVNVLGPVDVIRDGKTGILVEPDVSRFASACTDLLNDPEKRSALGESAREWALTHTSQTSTQKLLEVYQSALADPGEPA